MLVDFLVEFTMYNWLAAEMLVLWWHQRVLRVVHGRIRDEVVFTVGDQTINNGESADVVESGTGKKIRREEWNVEALREISRRDPEEFVQKY